MDPTALRQSAQPLAEAKLSQSVATCSLADSPSLPSTLTQLVAQRIEPQLQVTSGAAVATLSPHLAFSSPLPCCCSALGSRQDWGANTNSKNAKGKVRALGSSAAPTAETLAQRGSLCPADHVLLHILPHPCTPSHAFLSPRIPLSSRIPLHILLHARAHGRSQLLPAGTAASGPCFPTPGTPAPAPQNAASLQQRPWGRQGSPPPGAASPRAVPARRRVAQSRDVRAALGEKCHDVILLPSPRGTGARSRGCRRCPPGAAPAGAGRAAQRGAAQRRAGPGPGAEPLPGALGPGSRRASSSRRDDADGGRCGSGRGGSAEPRPRRRVAGLERGRGLQPGERLHLRPAEEGDRAGPRAR